MANDDGYEVGFGKPPKHTRFKKGQSGNVSGKAKKAKDPYVILDKLLGEAVPIVKDGKKVTSTALEVVLTQLVRSAMKGGLAQTKVLLMLMASRPQQPDGPVVALTPEWITLLEDILTTSSKEGDPS